MENTQELNVKLISSLLSGFKLHSVVEVKGGIEFRVQKKASSQVILLRADIAKDQEGKDHIALSVSGSL